MPVCILYFISHTTYSQKKSVINNTSWEKENSSLTTFGTFSEQTGTDQDREQGGTFWISPVKTNFAHESQLRTEYFPMSIFCF